MKLIHNKIKNTGLIYECLLRTITQEVMEGKDSPAVNILKRFFYKTELAKEYKLYQLLNNNKLSESKANMIVNSLIDQHKKINKSLLRNEKYNLIKELKELYNVDEFFKYKINNYKQLASLYLIFEAYSNKSFSDPSLIINHKSTLIEHLTSSNTKNKEESDILMEEYINLDKGTKMLVFKNLINKFNERYSILSNNQKIILKEYINNFDNIPKLKEFFNKQQDLIKKELSILYYRIEDKTTQIKLNETIELLKPLTTVKDEDVISLMSYYELINELEKVTK